MDRSCFQRELSRHRARGLRLQNPSDRPRRGARLRRALHQGAVDPFARVLALRHRRPRLRRRRDDARVGHGLRPRRRPARIPQRIGAAAARGSRATWRFGGRGAKRRPQRRHPSPRRQARQHPARLFDDADDPARRRLRHRPHHRRRGREPPHGRHRHPAVHVSGSPLGRGPGNAGRRLLPRHRAI